MINIKNCIICGKEYTKNSKETKEKWNSRKYCSHKCYQPTQKGRIQTEIAKKNIGKKGIENLKKGNNKESRLKAVETKRKKGWSQCRPEVRAKNNRTTFVKDNEMSSFKKNLLSVNEVNNNFYNKTIYGKLEEVAVKLPSGFVDLLFIDPPYNLNKDFGNNQFKIKKNDDYEAIFEEWLLSIIHTLKKDASVYVCCDWKSSPMIFNVLSKHLKVRNRITWEREKGRGALSNWKNCSEDIWFATLSDDYKFNVDAVKLKKKVLAPYRENGVAKDWAEEENGNFRLTHPSNFWTDITIPFWSMPENTDHPTQKPEKLVAKIILASTNEGDVVLDPFLGSGTTSVVAKKLNRKYVGIEMNEEYCCLAEKRIGFVDDDKTIQGYSGGVFWERNSGVDQMEEVK